MFRLTLLAVIAMLVLPFMSHAQDGSSNVTDPKFVKVQLALFTSKQIYKQTDEIALNAMLVNEGMFDVYIYRKLDWGGLASFTLCVRDADGRIVRPRFLADAITYLKDPAATTEYVKLQPLHFLGSIFETSVHDLNIEKPGRYSLNVQYLSPIPRSKVAVKPFWGKEDGTLETTLTIEIVR